MGFIVDKMKDEDWTAVQSIYREGIATSNATFETKVPDWEEWNKGHLLDCRRPVYSGVAEVSVYIASSARATSVGKALLHGLIQESERAGIWTLQGMSFPENTASIALQRSCGFREVGYRERIGQMNGLWRDVILMERRSKVAGT